MKNLNIEEKVRKELLVDLTKLMKSDIKDKSTIKSRMINHFINDCKVIYPINDKDEIIFIINNIVNQEIDKKQNNTGLNDFDYDSPDNSINSGLERIVIKEIKEAAVKCDKKEELNKLKDVVLNVVSEKYPELDKSFVLTVINENIKREWMSVKYIRPLIEAELYPCLSLQDEATREDIVKNKRENRTNMVIDFIQETKNNKFPEESIYDIRKIVMKTLYEVEKVEKKGMYFVLDDNEIKNKTRINEEEIERDEN